MLALCLTVTFFILVLYLAYYSLTRKHNYWKKKGVPHLKPETIFGNYKEYVLFKKCAPKVAHEICKKFPNEPYVGVYYGSDPALIVKDPELIKLILSKDFYYFNLREVSDHTHKEVITQNMFFTGGDRWKVLRQNLSPMFSSKKLKNMFYLIEVCSKTITEYMRTEIQHSNVIEVRSLLAKYTMDCIGNCVFGVNTGTLDKKTDNNPFTIMGNKIFDVSTSRGFKMVARAMWPSIFYSLQLKMFSEDINEFFHNLLIDVFKTRNYKESGRHDFIDLLLNWTKKDFIFGDSVSNNKKDEKSLVEIKVDDECLVSQCVMFFAAGYETTATTTSFILYELAKHQEAQIRVIEEIDEYYERHDGKIEFEAINEMPYLQACISETLRLYPVLGVITREVFEDYTFPNGLLVEKGTRIHIPVYHNQMNPTYFQNPEEFRPERFLGDEKKNIKPFTYLPFGEGPRICIGMRFAKMPMVTALLAIFKNYQVETTDRTPNSFDFEPRAITTQPLGGIYLKFLPRN